MFILNLEALLNSLMSSFCLSRPLEFSMAIMSSAKRDSFSSSFLTADGDCVTAGDIVLERKQTKLIVYSKVEMICRLRSV